MQSLLGKLTLHLLAATSVPIAVLLALVGIWMLPGWIALPAVAQAAIRAAVPALAAVTLATYAWHFTATVRTYLRGRTSGPVHVEPPEPEPLERVARNVWEGVGSSFVLFLLFVGISLLLGLPARGTSPGEPYHFFVWLERGALLVSVAAFVFTQSLMATHAQRGVLRSFYFALNEVRRTELRPNLPFDVAVVALPIFIALLVMELR